MKFKKRYFLLPTAVVLICLLFLYNKVLRPVRIACIGDSITYGAHVKERTKNCYPAQLQNLLGKDYLVRNFGASGYSLQKNSDRSYWNHEYFQKAPFTIPILCLSC